MKMQMKVDYKGRVPINRIRNSLRATHTGGSNKSILGYVQNLLNKNTLLKMVLLLSMLGTVIARNLTKEEIQLCMVQNMPGDTRGRKLSAKKFYHGVSDYSETRTFTVSMRKSRCIRKFSTYQTRQLTAHIDRGVLQFFSYVYGLSLTKGGQAKFVTDLEDHGVKQNDEVTVDTINGDDVTVSYLNDGISEEKMQEGIRQIIVKKWDLTPLGDSYNTKKFQIKRIGSKGIMDESSTPLICKGSGITKGHKVLLTLVSTTRKGKRKNKYLSLNSQDESKDFLEFCRQYQVPFHKDYDYEHGAAPIRETIGNSEELVIAGDYAHALYNGRYPAADLIDDEKFTIELQKNNHAGSSYVTIQAKMTKAGNLAYFTHKLQKKKCEKMHIKCIMRPGINKYLLIQTKSTKVGNMTGNVASRWINYTNDEEQKFLDFCRRYNVPSHDNWLQNMDKNVNVIPVRQDVGLWAGSNNNENGNLVFNKNKKVSGHYLFTIRHANAPKKVFTDGTALYQEARAKFAAKHREQETRVRNNDMMDQLDEHWATVNTDVDTLKGKVVTVQKDVAANTKAIKEVDTKIDVNTNALEDKLYAETSAVEDRFQHYAAGADKQIKKNMRSIGTVNDELHKIETVTRLQNYGEKFEEPKMLTKKWESNDKALFGNIDVYKTMLMAYAPFKVSAGGIVATTGGMAYLFSGMRTGIDCKGELTAGVTDNKTETPTFVTTLQTKIDELKNVTLINLTVKDQDGKKCQIIWVGKNTPQECIPKPRKVRQVIKRGGLMKFKYQIKKWFESWCAKKDLNKVYFEMIREAQNANGNPVKMSWTPGRMEYLQKRDGRACVLMFDNGGMTFKVTKRDGTQILSGTYDPTQDHPNKVKDVKTVNDQSEGKLVDSKQTTMEQCLEFVKTYITDKIDGQYDMTNVAVGYTGTWRTDKSLEDQKAVYDKIFIGSRINKAWIADVTNADEAKYMGMLMNNFIDGHRPGRFTDKVCCEVSSSTGQFFKPTIHKETMIANAMMDLNGSEHGAEGLRNGEWIKCDVISIDGHGYQVKWKTDGKDSECQQVRKSQTPEPIQEEEKMAENEAPNSQAPTSVTMKYSASANTGIYGTCSPLTLSPSNDENKENTETSADAPKLTLGDAYNSAEGKKGIIAAVNADGTYNVQFDDGELTKNIHIPHRNVRQRSGAISKPIPAEKPLPTEETDKPETPASRKRSGAITKKQQEAIVTGNNLPNEPVTETRSRSTSPAKPAPIQLNDPVNNPIAVPEVPIAEEPQPEPETVDTTVTLANPAEKKMWGCDDCAFTSVTNLKHHINPETSEPCLYGDLTQKTRRRRLENRPIHRLAKLIQQAQA